MQVSGLGAVVALLRVVAAIRCRVPPAHGMMPGAWGACCGGARPDRAVQWMNAGALVPAMLRILSMAGPVAASRAEHIKRRPFQTAAGRTMMLASPFRVGLLHGG